MRLSNSHLMPALLLLAITSAMSQSSTYQNVVVIIGDDLGVDALSCFDADRLCNDDPSTGASCSEPAFSPSTPAICSDLAGSGTRFFNAWANPVCTPTRSSILTGRYAFRTGLLSAGTPLPLHPDGSPVETTLAMILRDAGFSTGIFGKWHLGGNNFNSCGSSAETHPGNHGFDIFDGAFSNIIPAFAGYNNWLRTVQPGTEPDPEWDCENETEYAAFEYTDSAIAWIQQQTGPYFLWMAHHLPHTPLHVPPRKDKDACSRKST